MKRMLLGLLVVSLAVAGAGTAFALDTGSFTPPPTQQQDYQNALPGAGSLVVVGNPEQVMEQIPAAAQANLVTYLEAAEAAGTTASVAYVSFELGEDGTVEYTWEEGEALYNFTTNTFDVNSASAAEASVAAAKTIVFDGTTDYEDKTTPAGSTAFLSVKSEAQPSQSGGGDDSGGCSMLTLGAVALFLLPAFALVKRGKK